MKPVATFALAIGIAVLSCASAQAQPRAVAERDTAVVTTMGGNLDGVRLPSGVEAYLGIPYAAPPVRDLRWRPPEPAKPWDGTFHADRFGPQCPQPLRGIMTNQYSGAEVSSEDCLYLNVWGKPGLENAPVIVFIHGGGFFVGSGSMPLYSGEHLAERDVVAVNFNYRLGALGFLAHPDLTAESPDGASGNYGFLDQVAALEWVRDNIDRFGGDPDNVTIVGQSAGSMSVLALEASPLAEGLFDRAVGMSGALIGDLGPAAIRPLDDAEADGVRIQDIWGASSLEEMRSLAPDRLLDLPRTPGSPRLGPVRDGRFLTRSIDNVFESGGQHDVPLVLGFTKDESFGGFGPVSGLAEYEQRAQERFGVRADEFLRLYPASTDEEAMDQARQASRDATMAMPMLAWATQQHDHGESPVFSYQFARAHQYPDGLKIAGHDVASAGAYHTSEVPFWLGTLESFNLFRPTRAWSERDRELSDRLQDALVTFAATGSPTTASLEWPRFDPADPHLLLLDIDDDIASWPSAAKFDFFRSIAEATSGH